MDIRSTELQLIKEEFATLSPSFTEKQVRIWCAVKARSYNKSYGRGGSAVVHEATRVAKSRIHRGLKDIKFDDSILSDSRVRRSGGGRKKIQESQPDIESALESLVEPDSKGDPESPLRWTSKSTTKLSAELCKRGFKISKSKVHSLLRSLNYSLQLNKKNIESETHHPDRNDQFHLINNKVKIFQEKGQPTISVDTKKKEKIGNYQNGGREYHKKGNAPEVSAYDFINKEKGKVSPYGIYDLLKNNGFVNVGISSDTAEFAVNSIGKWWKEMGKELYPKATQILVTADCGGSNGNRTKLWKVKLQELAIDINMDINVCHFPPGTSKWNKIEHSMFSFISKNWRGVPLETRATVVNLINNTTTTKGLKIRTVLDENIYEKGIKISDSKMKELNIERNNFHGEWNYILKKGK